MSKKQLHLEQLMAQRDFVLSLNALSPILQKALETDLNSAIAWAETYWPETEERVPAQENISRTTNPPLWFPPDVDEIVWEMTGAMAWGG